MIFLIGTPLICPCQRKIYILQPHLAVSVAHPLCGLTKFFVRSEPPISPYWVANMCSYSTLVSFYLILTPAWLALLQFLVEPSHTQSRLWVYLKFILLNAHKRGVTVLTDCWQHSIRLRSGPHSYALWVGGQPSRYDLYFPRKPRLASGVYWPISYTPRILVI